jgi:drug/metabolite transporter (DMT)-like permease
MDPLQNKRGDNNNTTDEGSPLLIVPSSLGTCSSEIMDISSSSTTTATTPPSPSLPTSSQTSSTSTLLSTSNARLLLLSVSLMYGSLSVALRMVYGRPGPPTPSVLSATRGWMAVLCLLPFIIFARPNNNSNNMNDHHHQNDNDNDNSKDIETSALTMTRAAAATMPPRSTTPSLLSMSSTFWMYAFELAFFNFATQGLINIGLLTTASARSAFFTQLSVVITPILSAILGTKHGIIVHPKVWFACSIALFGLYVLSSDDVNDDNDEDGSGSGSGSGSILRLTQGDLYCLGSAFCWSYYIYRLSDWGDRFDETQTMFVKNIFMAIFYSLWAIISWWWFVPTGSSLWEGWMDPISWLILFYSAFSSGALSDVLQQKAQAVVPAAESNVILSLEPVFSAVLGLCLLGEVPSFYELIGGGFIVIASVLASTV